MPQNPITIATLKISSTQITELQGDANSNLKVVIATTSPGLNVTMIGPLSTFGEVEVDATANLKTALGVTTSEQLKVGPGVLMNVDMLNETNLGYLTTTQQAALTPTSIVGLYDALASTGIGPLTTTAVAALASTQLMGFALPTQPLTTFGPDGMKFTNGLVVNIQAAASPTQPVSLGYK